MSMLLKISDSQHQTSQSQTTNSTMSKTNSQNSSSYQDSNKQECQSNKSSGSSSTMQSNRFDQNYNNGFGQNKRHSGSGYHKSKKSYYNNNTSNHHQQKRHPNYYQNSGSQYGQHYKNDKYQNQQNKSNAVKSSGNNQYSSNNSNSGKHQNYNQQPHDYYNNTYKNNSERATYHQQQKQRQFGIQLNGQNTGQNQFAQNYNQQAMYWYPDEYGEYDNQANAVYLESDQNNYQGSYFLQNGENNPTSMAATSQSSPSLDWINEQNRMQSKESSSDISQSVKFSIKPVNQAQIVSSQQNTDYIRTNEMESNNSCSGATTSVSSASQHANQDSLFAINNFTVDIQSQYQEESLQATPVSQKQVILCQGSIQVPTGNVEVIIRKGDLVDAVIGQIMQLANFSPDLELDMKITLQSHFQRQVDQATEQLTQNDQTLQKAEIDDVQNAAKVFDSESLPFYPCQNKLSEFDQILHNQH